MITVKDYRLELLDMAASIPYLRALEGTSILITGASGLIGSYLIDLLGSNNLENDQKCKIYAVGRSFEKIRQRFPEFISQPWFCPIIQDVSSFCGDGIQVDYIIHCASNAHPALYAKDPVGTITTNVFGTYQLLKYAHSVQARKMIQLSSVEIYGENRGDVECFDEMYCGSLNCNTARGGYPESKRVSETLCHSFIQAYGVNVVIARPCRSYGPTMDMSDSKATAQFIKSTLRGSDIVLKSTGLQRYSYAYVADVVSGLITLLIRGVNGEAYNISDRKSVICLKDLAELVASISGTKVVYNFPDEAEMRGFSGTMNAVLDPSKLEQLGWQAKTHLKEGMIRTISTLKNKCQTEYAEPI